MVLQMFLDVGQILFGYFCAGFFLQIRTAATFVERADTSQVA